MIESNQHLLVILYVEFLQARLVLDSIAYHTFDCHEGERCTPSLQREEAFYVQIKFIQSEC